MTELKNSTATAGLIASDAQETMAERLTASRERYSNAIADALKAEMEAFLLPTDRAALLEDALGFTGFLLTTMMAEEWKQQPTKKNLIMLWTRLWKQTQRTVPESLLAFATAAEAAAREPSA